MLRESITDFARQTYPERELLIVHDGDAAFDGEVKHLAQVCGGEAAKAVHAMAPMPLGALRNAAHALARGELVCQWDDDDRFHPLRLQIQHDALVRQSADFCFLSDQLHFYRATGEMFWDDWDSQPYPLNFVQGTLLGRREKMPVYPDLARGEDTGACLEIIRAGHKIARLRHQGWCYVYVHHGANAWPGEHHRAISRGHALPAARLMARLPELHERLAEYAPTIEVAALKDRSGGVHCASVR